MAQLIPTKTAFLNQFDSLLRPHVIEFGKRLSDIRSDVVMLMARKAVCFVDCLRALGLTSSHGMVTSDRILDMDTKWLSGKTVTIIDEAIVSGSTLYRATEALRAAGASPTIVAFCVNTDWWSPDLVRPETPYLALDQSNAASFCANIVDALSLVPHPYAVAFPLFSNIRLPARDIDALGTMSGWETDDVSSPLQRDHDVFCVTATPSEEMLAALDASCGWPVSEHSLSKVRVYGRYVDSERSVWWCRLLPIVAFDPLSRDGVNGLWNSILPYATRHFGKWFSSASSKMRLVQYVTAARLARLWVNSVRAVINSDVVTKQDTSTLYHLFPPVMADQVRELADSDAPILGEAPPTNTIEVRGVELPSTSAFVGANFLSVQARLTEPFVNFYTEKEVEARRLALRHGRDIFAKPEYQHIRDRLRRGFSLPQLRVLLKHLEGSFDVNKLVSLYLDQAIDRGIVVPITVEDDGAVYRGYRHGEDVEFGRGEERLCGLMLESACQGAGRVELPHLWVEKLLVLLVRIGLEKQILNPWSGQLGDPRSVGVRYALKGAVLGSGTTKLYQYNPDGALSNLLQQAGILKRVPNSHLYALGRIPTGGTHATAESEARRLGNLVGKMLAAPPSSPVPKLSEEEITLLATCLQPNDTAGAVAASISIFSSAWRRMTGIYGGQVDGTKHTELADELRQGPAFEAINSGSWKFRRFMEGRPWTVIQRLASEFHDPIYAETWRSFWPPAGKQQDTAISDELKSLISREGLWCITANIYVRMIEIALRYRGESGQAPRPLATKLSAKLTSVLGETQDLSTHLTHHFGESIARRLVRHVDEMTRRVESRELNADLLREYAVRELDRLTAEALQLLAEVDLVVMPFGRPRTVSRFAHAMHIHIRPTKRGDTTHRLLTLLTGYQSRMKKGGPNEKPTRLAIIPRDQGSVPYGRWVCAAGNMARAWLIRLAAELGRELGTAGDIRMTLFAHLPDNGQLMLAEKTSLFEGPFFWERAKAILGDVHGSTQEAGLVCVTETNERTEAAISAEVSQEMGDLVVVGAHVRRVTLEQPLPYRVTVTTHTLRGDRSRSGGPVAKQEQADIGVITVVTEETQAMRDMLREQPGYEESRGEDTIRWFYRGSLTGENGNRHRVVCTQALKQGNRAIIPAYFALADYCRPRLVVLLGIAGSIHKDAELCDVVIADQVLYYDKRKETPHGVCHRLEAYEVAAWLRPVINHLFVLHGEPARLKSDAEPHTGTFGLRQGPIGTGEAVIGYREAEERKWLQSVNDKTLALDTEAGGLGEAFYEDQLRSGYKADGYLVIRGISDHADCEKDDKWRMIASKNAAKTLEVLVSQLPALGTLLRAQV